MIECSRTPSMDLEGTVRRFEVSIDEAEITSLKTRLGETRWPDELRGAGWEYGSDLSYIKELAHHWQHEFDWRQSEAKINSFSNFKLLVNGIDIHFVHERSLDPNAIPLIFIHGWPGSVVESFKIIRRLTHPAGKFGGPAFHVVVPSLPGYGFSSAPQEPGFGVAKTAAAFNRLMLAIGYSTYVAQGGDIGAAVSSVLAADYSQYCRAIHLNFVPIPFCFGHLRLTNPWHVAMYLNARLPILNHFPLAIDKEEMGYLDCNNYFTTKESAYSRLQATKPQTVGYGLNDSPAGLLAYIIEKFRTWSDCGGDVEQIYNKDELLTNISTYWFNANITSSFCMYYESLGPWAADLDEMASKYVKVPTAVAVFEKEILKSPKAWASGSYNIQQWSTFKSGGHFAALEKPEELIEDMSKFFAQHH